MKALLPLSLLLLAGCGITETSTDPLVSTGTQGGGGSSGGGGSTGSGGGGSSPTSPPAGATVTPSGIWDVSDTVNGKPVTEVTLIAAGQFFSLASADEFGCADVTGGTYAVDHSTFTGSGYVVALNNCTAPNGQGYLPYTLNGYMTGSELQLSYEVQGVLIPTLGATLDPLYNETSSLTKLVGNWDDNGNTLSINSDGTFFEQQADGCVVNGTYTIIDPTHNLYGVAFEITNCNSSIANIEFKGLGYIDDSDPSAVHFLEDMSGPDPANGGALTVVFDNITPM